MNEQLHEPGEEDSLPPPVKLPAWVPVAISLVLIAMAAGAIWTGLRRRDVPFWKPVPSSRGAYVPGAGVPGEPEPGASRVMHGGDGALIPVADPTDRQQRSRVSIQGDSRAVTPTVRVQARRGLLVDVRPADAIVYVNDQLIGEAQQFMTPEQAWEFAEPSGTYRVVVVSQGYEPLQYEVIASPDAQDELAIVRGQLELQ